MKVCIVIEQINKYDFKYFSNTFQNFLQIAQTKNKLKIFDTIFLFS